MKSKAKTAAKELTTSRTSTGLCEALFQEFDLLRNGKSDAHRASAVAKLAIQIINTKRLEMDAVMFIGQRNTFKPVQLSGAGLQLGAK
jgi:hypothetical protein